jgi:hypothetical protein
MYGIVVRIDIITDELEATNGLLQWSHFASAHIRSTHVKICGKLDASRCLVVWIPTQPRQGRSCKAISPLGLFEAHSPIVATLSLAPRRPFLDDLQLIQATRGEDPLARQSSLFSRPLTPEVWL